MMRALTLHNQLAERALIWLANRATQVGIRAAIEVQLDKGYIADAVAVGWLQHRFYVDYCCRSELQPMTQRYNVLEQKIESIGEIERSMIYVFEAKATRSDFLSTFGPGPKHQNRHTPLGSLHWVVVAKGIARPEEVPGFWGLLEWSGCGLSERKRPIIQITTREHERMIAERILWKPSWGLRHRWPEIGIYLDPIEGAEYQI